MNLSKMLTAACVAAMFSTIGFAQCPTLTVTGPADPVKLGQPMHFVAKLTGGNPKAKPTFEWSVRGQKIIKGEGTLDIVVDSTGLDPGDFTAVLIVENYYKDEYRNECQLSDSASVEIIAAHTLPTTK